MSDFHRIKNVTLVVDELEILESEELFMRCEDVTSSAN